MNEHHSMSGDDNRDTKVRSYGDTIDKINRCETIDEGTSRIYAVAEF